MDQTTKLIAQLDRERIERARRMSPEEKLTAGPKLFSLALECMRTAILLQDPDANEAKVKRLIHERFEEMRRTDEAGLYGST